jgi:hypothetical protein
VLQLDPAAIYLGTNHPAQRLRDICARDRTIKALTFTGAHVKGELLTLNAGSQRLSLAQPTILALLDSLFDRPGLAQSPFGGRHGQFTWDEEVASIAAGYILDIPGSSQTLNVLQ